MGEHARAAGREVVAGERPETELDLCGEVCPYTFLKARLALEALPADTVLRIVVDNETSARDVPRSLAAAGHVVVGSTPSGAGVWTILARRAPA
jgi:tRNA 2-thiouridine synthesizing protein A